MCQAAESILLDVLLSMREKRKLRPGEPLERDRGDRAKAYATLLDEYMPGQQRVLPEHRPYGLAFNTSERGGPVFGGMF